MSSRTQINVDIVSQYKGKAEVKKAQSDLAALGGEAKKLAGYFGASLGTAAVVAFGKSAVTAFAADQKSALILGNTLNNVGQQMADIPIEKFITNLSEVNGIAKTDLRTAFDSFVRYTGSATKAQDLLNLSLNVSAGTGKDLATTSTAIAKAYGGNVVALGRLGTGISKNDLKTKSFIQIQQQLNDLFTGDAAIAADSYAGKIARVGTIWEEFKIKIGTGITDAFSVLDNSAGLTGFQKSMDTIATDVSDIIVGIGVMGEKLHTVAKTSNSVSFGFLGTLAKAVENSFILAPIKVLYTLGKTKVAAQDLAKTQIAAAQDVGVAGAAAAYLAAQAQKKIADAKAKADAAALLAANKLKDAATAKLKAERDSLTLKLAGQTTDMQNIEIQAALQRGQTQQVTDVLLLQRAILDGNAAQADILAQQVLRSNGLVMDVAGNISSLKGAKNPFADWPPASASALADITAIQTALAALVAKPYTIHVKATIDNPGGVPIPITGGDPLSGNGTGGDQGGAAHPNDSSVPSISGGALPQYNYNTNPANGADRAGGQGTISVTVNLDGKTVAGALTDTLVNNSASGIPSSFSRSLQGVW